MKFICLGCLDKEAWGRLSADELLDRYCAAVYQQTDSYVETGRRLGLDRRTVKERVERGRASAHQGLAPGAGAQDVRQQAERQQRQEHRQRQ